MNKKEFDGIIKNNLIKRYGEENFGYSLSKTKKYEYYYSKEIFKVFLDEMEQSFSGIFSRYDLGKGGELKEQNGKWGTYPPKMASVASSSRFCYLALRNGGKAIKAVGVPQFEYGLKIKGILGVSPQLDCAFLKENIFVEAKCHEIFDAHKVILKEKYKELIYGENNEFGFRAKEVCGEKFEIPLSEFGIEKTNSMFDIKQLLCHLMGIASQKERKTTAELIYLFFMPKVFDKETEKQISDVFCELEKEIKSIFLSKPIEIFTQKNNIRLKAVAEYSESMEELNNENLRCLFK